MLTKLSTSHNQTMIPKNFFGNSQFSSDFPNSLPPVAKPSPEFYAIFSQKEILDLIRILELTKEIPLKYSYKGRGAKIWNNFYQKYIIPKWFQKTNVEIDLLQKNFEYINGSYQNSSQVNIVDVGAGNSYPVKNIIAQLNKLGRINKYIALDISQELLNLSKANISKWFPVLQFDSCTIDIENSSIPPEILLHSTNENIANIFLHLGVTIGNHQNRSKVLQNLRNTMDKKDLLVFTNEIGSNSNWNGQVRGGCKYHVDGIYTWIKDNIGIRSEDCELVRKYDSQTDSITASIKFNQSYTLSFTQLGIDQNLEFAQNEEIVIWRHHKYEIPEMIQELEKAGLQLVHHSRNQYSSHIMAICQVNNS
ncbi:L-histidine N(alpha)-methyltransferase [Umezakia ovalisporum]|uniref:L-histidine N(Alpha)-methyltransferase n=2 Tax=Umezakia ovalisporum TaxID=75695 RepID=A0AA43GXU8_9CYAN|nr:L-histidine N(alpha)-methyltransferase [Umezakia ovalisporum]MDH6058200.1 L-histidine N(alpha)-methyltransferase [Umezakia ovalisporum FSS-43]MDH6063771.1 L-histidine N(alpha)-methyltransferase [Umezakia ovalisporum FSS-62]MDH6069206.1 L-histidine N(alpha)-methyltransferase [Umezakia ovalisporum APH033B]MDH6072313.1 L-histidine N(alpha)-methyltransferase [Umezakia ovalisporum CobakiLakeA]MDH6076278.1 L-histidine N(alpha)-methyltransferase [Umezakia ovalisporum CS-1034]